MSKALGELNAAYTARGDQMKVGRYMTQKVITAAPEEGTRSVFFRMREHGVRHLPVVDENRKLLGLISDRDLRRPDWVDESFDIAHSYKLDDSYEVKDLMTTKVIVVQVCDTIEKAIDVLLGQGVGVLPVVNRANALVGILSPVDLLRAFREVLSDHSYRARSSKVW